jgi:hypothetical protein
MTTPLPRLLDERERPDFREAFGRLASGARVLESAVRRIRLTTLDLSVGELAGLDRIRLLLAEVMAPRLDAEAHAALRDPVRAVTLRHLIDELRRGRVEVRSAPLGGWSPDFSIFHDGSGPRAGLLGAHWLERPFPYRGPAWGVVLDREEARRAADRFRELWARAYDVSPALNGLLARAADRVGTPDDPGPIEGPLGGGEPDPLYIASSKALALREPHG